MSTTAKTMDPIHPVEILREEYLAPLGMTANRLALELHVPATRIHEIVNERRAISADTALRLARHFATTAQFWINLQSNYELDLARDAAGKEILKRVRVRR
ncbi:MAG: HigA family addiction module antidote protein [Bryobacterales bacterium]|nr:HigA family addiction module antidote protein [Bryobacterales bacterium]